MHTYKITMQMPGHTKTNYMMVNARTEKKAVEEVLRRMALIFPETEGKIKIVKVDLG